MRPFSPILLALILFAGCGQPARPNVVVIVIDTLRADRVGPNAPAGLTPYLGKFAEGAVSFDQCHAHAPWTLPSCAAILSGVHPAEHGAGGNLEAGLRGLGQDVGTLVLPFARAGYDTHAIVNVAFLDKTFGVTRDFGGLDAVHFKTNIEVRRAAPTTQAALNWLDRERDEPFLLFVHYFDPHAVYDPPQPFRRRFAEPRDQKNQSFVFGTRKHMMALRAGKLDLNPEVIGRAEALYNGEVAYTDAEVGRLLDGLSERGLDKNSIVVITGDHGEEFLDHGGFEHGHTLYDELTHVPLMIRVPGEGAQRISDTVRHVDLAPTLCELADLAPLSSFVGRSLVGLMGGTDSQPRPVLAQGNMWGPDLTSYRTGGWKLIRAGDGKEELYNLLSDPYEQRDLAGNDRGNRARLAEQLDLALRGMAALGGSNQVEVTPQLQSWLEALGYAGESQ
jgi:arylsulfatase A-like enzyme